MVKKSDKIFQMFQEQCFPVEKAQFFILKCQISDMIK